MNLAPSPDTAPPRVRRTLQLLAFVALALALLQAYRALPSELRAELVVHRLTVAPAAGLIDRLRPDDGVLGVDDRLVWRGGSLRLRTGCDGVDVLALYLAALLVATRGTRLLAWGAAGVLVLWSLNQLRLLALYASFRYRPELFDAIHAVWAPLLLLGAAAGLYRAALK